MLLFTGQPALWQGFGFWLHQELGHLEQWPGLLPVGKPRGRIRIRRKLRRCLFVIHRYLVFFFLRLSGR